MRINWFGTTAVALLIGTGAVVAQQPDQKREEAPRTQSPSASSPSAPSKDAEHPGAGEQRPADRMKDRTTQSEPKAGAKEPPRGEAASPSERRQAQEPSQGRDSKQPTKQNQEQPSRGEHSPATQTQQSQDEQKGRDGRQPAEPKQQGRSEQPKQDNRAVDERRPADAKQQQGQRQPEPSTTPSAQQGARTGDSARDRQQQGQNTGQRPDQSAGRTGTSSVTANDDQRRQIAERLQRERSASNENINIRVNVGERLPPRVRPHPLPPEIVQIAPQYRDYEYTVINDDIAIVDPRSREVVDIIDDTGAAGGRMASRRDRVVITREQRDQLKQVARRTVGSASSSGSVSDSSCLQLQPMPEELTRNNPELSQYRYLAIGDEVVLVDPRQQKIVQVID